MIRLPFRLKKLVSKVPNVGDPVWWASKQLGCIVTELQGNGTVIFQGGEIVKNGKGREVPRWTVATFATNAVWNGTIHMWVVGEGPAPKDVRGTVITPDSVLLSGVGKGSFAVTGGK
jgi:hypothetical protein